MNASKDEPVHFLQIWILPEKAGIRPGYEQKKFEDEERRGTLRLVASPDAAEGSVTIHQDVRLYATLLDGDQTVTHALAPGRYGWVQVARGEVELNGQTLKAGDGAAIEGEPSVTLRGTGAEVLLFDLN
jgi:redox-sensitive bicupin YhaK (pirin superfamily)